jgi:hypothetical protein
MILGDELGIGHDPGQHAAYVGTWINALRDDPLEIFRAAADAEKIHGYVLALEQQQVQEQTSQQAQTQDSAQNQDGAENHDNTENQEAAMKSFTQTPVLASAALDSSDGEAAVADPRLDPINPHEQAARLARIEEERVRRDPNSTDEDIAAAREARKSADVAALLNDKDLQRQIAEHEREQQTTQAGQVDQASQSSKIWIDVPYPQKDEAKALGARWDRQEQSWYVPAGVDPAPFARWTPATAPQARPKQSPATPPRQYLAVPYGERVAAKAAGAVWDKAAKSWYAGPKADLAKLKRWKPENVPTQQGPAMTPRDEFAEALRSIGCVVSGEHPIMDGQKHRISVEGEKHSEKSGSGFYVGHLDGHPAGYMKNNKTGIDLKWKSKGYAFDPEQKARMLAEAAEKLQARTAEQERLHEQTAQRVARQMDEAAAGHRADRVHEGQGHRATARRLHRPRRPENLHPGHRRRRQAMDDAVHPGGRQQALRQGQPQGRSASMRSAAWTRWPRRRSWSSAKATPPPAACHRRWASRPSPPSTRGTWCPSPRPCTRSTRTSRS